VDSNNDIIVTGYSCGLNIGPDDYLTIKYSSTGVPLWTNRYHAGNDSEDKAYAVAVDADNNVIVTGFSSPSGLGYCLTAKYNRAAAPCSGPIATGAGQTAPARRWRWTAAGTSS